MSANVGVSATAATSCSTSCSPIGSSPAQSASLSTSFASWWKSSPTSWTSAATASGSRPDAGLLEALRDPRVGLPLRDVEREHVARLRAGLRQRCVLLQLLGDERQHGARRRRGEVLLDRLHVGCLPAVREPALAVATPVHAFDEDEPRVAEEAAGVAEGGGLGARLLLGADDLRRLRLEVAAKPRERGLDLGPVAAGEQIDRLERGRLGHDASLLNAPNAPRSAGRPTRARRGRPRRCGTGCRPGLSRSAASVDGVGWP